MLSKFEITLKDSENDINRNMGSLFHGALMEMVSRDYGDYLHENHLKPFSQSIFKRDDEFKWIVNCLDRESSEIFNDILMNRLDKVEIKNKNKTFEMHIEKYADHNVQKFDRQYIFLGQCKNI